MILSENATAVVTGASSGIGRATALALARKGTRLALLSRSHMLLEEVVNQAIAIGSRDAFFAVVDVRDEGAVNEVVATALDRFDRIDVLINSAGLSINGEVDGYPLADWRTVLDTNLTGTFLTCRAVLPAMRRQRGGQIVNISSGAGRNGIKEMAAYSAAKFGVIGFTESLALEVRHENIRVSTLLPGSVATDFSRKAGAQQRTDAQIGYSMLPEEVAGVILSMIEQPDQAWTSEVVLRPLNLELRRSTK